MCKNMAGPIATEGEGRSNVKLASLASLQCNKYQDYLWPQEVETIQELELVTQEFVRIRQPTQSADLQIYTSGDPSSQPQEQTTGRRLPSYKLSAQSCWLQD